MMLQAVAADNIAPEWPVEALPPQPFLPPLPNPDGMPALDPIPALVCYCNHG